ncbi:hypothetical protein DR74_5384 [Enterobacter cloacae]|nr:hypothetical protein DR74_5384 [Enterobacter cloacae]
MFRPFGMLHFDVSAKHCIRDFINKDTEITEKVLKFRFKRCTIAVMNETLMCTDNNRMLEIVFQGGN